MGDYIDRTKLLTGVNNGIKAGNYEDGYERYQNINNMDDIIEAIEWADKADVIERSKIDKAFEELQNMKVYVRTRTARLVSLPEVFEILKKNIGE